MEDYIERLGRSLVLMEEEEGDLTLSEEAWRKSYEWMPLDFRPESYYSKLGHGRGQPDASRPIAFPFLRACTRSTVATDVKRGGILNRGSVRCKPRPTHSQSTSGWDAKMRIRVLLDVRKPLKRALRLRSLGGEEGGRTGSGGAYRSPPGSGRRGAAIFDADMEDGHRGWETDWLADDRIGERGAAVTEEAGNIGEVAVRFQEESSENREHGDVGGAVVTSRRLRDEEGKNEPNHEMGRSGCLALLWNKDMVVQLYSFSNNHIDVDILDGTSIANWRFTGFYGELDASRRREVWEKLIRLSRQSDAPWLCAGDFNEILMQLENTGVPRPMWQIEDFRRALNYSDLIDLGFKGARFTWCNRRQAPETV
ncbi:UNVERIFIED_CONTAM: hypothetical protein Slati_3494300 [Sesamum latifolium]|uniref:Exo_endo_phos domain-containing protein n=1 Tax=Sesamum latifolium TaxID=2727402 RepID=A0AAW2UI24_9LAMI